MNKLRQFINEGRSSNGLEKSQSLNENKKEDEDKELILSSDEKKPKNENYYKIIQGMSRKQLISDITRKVKNTHNDQDIKDLKTFSDEELKDILIDLVEMNEKLSSSDLKDVKNSTGLSPDEQNDFIIIDSIADKVDAFKKSIEKLTSKIKTPEGEIKSQLVTDGLQEFIWQLGDYINASIDKINSGLNESYDKETIKQIMNSKNFSKKDKKDIITISEIWGLIDTCHEEVLAKTRNVKVPEHKSLVDEAEDDLNAIRISLNDFLADKEELLDEGINESQSGQNLIDSLSKDIAYFTGLRVTAVIDFIGSDVKFAKKLFTFAKKGSLKDRLSITNAVLNGNKEFLNEGVRDYSKQELLNFIENFADEQSSWGTQKLDADDVQFGAEIVTDGDKYLVDAIIKYGDGVKDKKGAAKWLANATMASGGNVSRQKDVLAKLRNSI